MIPILEEVLVVQKRLFLKEEVSPGAARRCVSRNR